MMYYYSSAVWHWPIHIGNYRIPWGSSHAEQKSAKKELFS